MKNYSRRATKRSGKNPILVMRSRVVGHRFSLLFDNWIGDELNTAPLDRIAYELAQSLAHVEWRAMGEPGASYMSLTGNYRPIPCRRYRFESSERNLGNTHAETA